jgi:hypothetical protein
VHVCTGGLADTPVQDAASGLVLCALWMGCGVLQVAFDLGKLAFLPRFKVWNALLPAALRRRVVRSSCQSYDARSQCYECRLGEPGARIHVRLCMVRLTVALSLA